MDDVADAVGAPDLTSALTKWTDEAKAELGQMMDQQVSPNGSPYAPLSPVTIKRKGHAKALYETGALTASVVGSGSGHVELINKDSVTLGTGHEKKGRPVASILHHGQGNIPARPFIGVTDNMADRAAELVADDLLSQIALL